MFCVAVQAYSPDGSPQARSVFKQVRTLPKLCGFSERCACAVCRPRDALLRCRLRALQIVNSAGEHRNMVVPSAPPLEEDDQPALRASAGAGALPPPPPGTVWVAMPTSWLAASPVSACVNTGVGVEEDPHKAG